MAEQTIKVLFVGTRGAARTVFAERILNRLGRGRFLAYGASAAPTEGIAPLTRYELERNNYLADGIAIDAVDRYTSTSSAPMDFVFIISEEAKGVRSATWPGDPLIADWVVSDPMLADDTDALQAKGAFHRTFAELERRISIFVNLPVASLDRLKLQKELDQIGRS